MSGMKYAWLLGILTFLGTITSAGCTDNQVCVFMQSCILSCSFPPGPEVVLHWIQVSAGDAQVHSYYHNNDQLANQVARFKGRTSLFKDQIPNGNASLKISMVEFADQGKYKCYSSTISGNKESYVSLLVEAPVGKIDIHQVGNNITCRSEGMYPEPKITWDTSFETPLDLQPESTVQRNDQQLYDISSSVIVPENVPDLDYRCTVSTSNGKWRRATLFKTTSSDYSGPETIVLCPALSGSLTDLTWRFNHSQIILEQTSADISYSDEWEQHIKGFTPEGITLQDLSSKQEGVYTCEVSNAEETYVTNTFLRISESEASSDSSTPVGAIVAGVVVGVIVCLGIGVGAVVAVKKSRSEKSRPKNSEEVNQMHPLKNHGDQQNM